MTNADINAWRKYHLNHGRLLVIDQQLSHRQQMLISADMTVILLLNGCEVSSLPRNEVQRSTSNKQFDRHRSFVKCVSLTLAESLDCTECSHHNLGIRTQAVLKTVFAGHGPLRFLREKS